MTVMKCDICGHEIEGQYHIDGYGRTSCMRHPAIMCYCCYRLCSAGNSVKVEPYGYFCPECNSRLVDAESAKRIAGYISSYYDANRFKIPHYELKLVHAGTLVKESGGDTSGEAAIGLAYSCTPYRILILRQLSRTGFARILAHEVLHLWQYSTGLELPSIYREGVCELGSYLFLKHLGKPEANVQADITARNANEIYGEGFRLLNSVYTQLGWEGVVKNLLRHRLP